MISKVPLFFIEDFQNKNKPATEALEKITDSRFEAGKIHGSSSSTKKQQLPRLHQKMQRPNEKVSSAKDEAI